MGVCSDAEHLSHFRMSSEGIKTLSAAKRHKSIKKNKRIYSPFQDHQESVSSSFAALSSLAASSFKSKVWI